MRAQATQQPCFSQPSRSFSRLLGTTLGRSPANTVANTSADEAACFLISLKDVLGVGDCFQEHSVYQMKVSSSLHASPVRIPVHS